MVAPVGIEVPGAGSDDGSTAARRAGWWQRPMLLEVGLLVVMVAWAGNFVAMKSGLARIPPVGYSLISFAIGSVVLLALAAAIEGRVSLPRRWAVTVLLLGGTAFGLNQILFPTGLAATTASNAALLIGTSPLLVMLVSALIGAERLTVAKVSGGLVSALGVALIVTAGGGSLSIGDRLAGDLLVLGAALCWATYISLSTVLLRDVSPLLATGWAMAAASVVILPIGAAQLATDWHDVRAEDLAAVTYTGLANGLGNAMVFLAVQRLGATHVTQMQFLIPALVVVLAALLLAEPIVAGQVVGGALIIAGIAWARRGPRRAAVREAEANAARPAALSVDGDVRAP